ncbi:MAG: polysaccharide biosynthesis C-terminal domain-containing protein [Gallionella sp.]
MITIIFGRAAQFVLALMMMRVATTLLSPEEMGRVSLVVTTTACFSMFLINPVGMFINRRLHSWQANGMARHYLMHYVRHLLLVALIAGITLLVFERFINFGLSINWLIMLVCGSLLFNTINHTAIPSLNLLGFNGKFVLLTLATIATSFFCATLLVYSLQFSAQYWLLGLIFGQALLGIVGTRVLFTQLKKTEDAPPLRVIRTPHLRTLFHFAWPVALAAGLSWVQGQGYRYLLEGQLGLSQLGLFVAGYGISAAMIVGFESVLTTYFQPHLYRDANQNDAAQQAQAWQTYAAAVIPSLLLTIALIIFLAPELTRIFLGEAFQAAAPFVIWGALAEAMRVLAGVYSLIAHVYMQTRWLVLPNVVGAALSIGSCLILIPQFGAMGAGMGLVFSGFVVVMMMHILLIRRVGGGVPLRPLLASGIAAVVLWGMAHVLHSLLNVASWRAVVGTLVPVGVAYLCLQYLLLRQHLAYGAMRDRNENMTQVIRK